MRNRSLAVLTLAAVLGMSAGLAQGAALLPPFKPADSIQAAQYRAYQQDFRRINGRYFRTNFAPKWDEGLAVLRTHEDPIAVRAMLDVFESSRPEVRRAIYEHCASIGHPFTDSLIAYESVFGRQAEDRAICADLMVDQALINERELAHTPKLVLATALKSQDETAVEAAAVLVDRLSLAEAIPALITAQVAQSAQSSDRNGPYGTILNGRQTAYVSDLQPVVADGAVAFDPGISVVTEGSVLQADEAAVTIYRTVVHDALVSLSSRVTGKPTGHLGYDQWRWKDWYETEYLALASSSQRPESE